MNKESIAPLVACMVLLGFGVLVGFMLFSMNVEDKAWTRAVYVFGSVESLAFAAAGFFFGREIHREQANKAEKRADKAEQKAENSQAEVATAKEHAVKAETKGKALAQAIKSKTAVPRSGGGSPLENVRRDISTSDAPPTAIDELAAYAEQLFPDSVSH